MTKDWAVTVDFELAADLTEEMVDGLLQLLSPRGAALAVPDRGVGVTLTCEGARDALTAATRGADVVEKALVEVGAQPLRVAGVEAITIEEQDRRLAEPAFPELVGAAAAGELLGVSRQRVHQLAAEHSDFPPPILRIPRLGSLWLAEGIHAFGARWERRAGRRRTVTRT